MFKNKYLSLRSFFYSSRLFSDITIRLYSKKNTKYTFCKAMNRISELFPHPQVTLYELSTKTPEKLYDMYFKCNSNISNTQMQNAWTCIYAFTWPEKMLFESMGRSKRQACETAALRALQWLYTNKKIDNKGSPIYDKKVLKEIRDKLYEPIHIQINERSIYTIKTIWNDYENCIKNLYENTSQEATNFSEPLTVVTKNSTIDDEENEYENTSAGAGDFSKALMVATKYSTEDISDEDNISDNEGSLDSSTEIMSELKINVHPVYGKIITPPGQSTMEKRDKVLQRKFESYKQDLTPLPIDEHLEQIMSTLDTSSVVVVTGAAGCGKSTRIPAAILQRCGAKTAAIVSQSRRLAAIGLADRVASEMNERVGESVGHQVRLSFKPPRPPCGSILFCTSGVLLRRLQLNPGLEGCTHVIIDEAHERDINTDLMLLFLKRALKINTNLKILVMSATLDTDIFTSYFDSCPLIEVPGKTFPVDILYLDDIEKKFDMRVKLLSTAGNSATAVDKPMVYCHEIVELIQKIDKNEPDGAILVFLSGWADIKNVKALLDVVYANSPVHLVLPVHSRLSTADQVKMFMTSPPGVRKIVLSTNIAESSITIPDVVYIIDSGAQKDTVVKEGTSNLVLETSWVSLANAKQRAGRAGRVQPGQCYKMYTKAKEEEFLPQKIPEILRVPLEQTALDCKTYAPGEKLVEMLSQVPQPPSQLCIQSAINDLIDIGALSPEEELTRLGWLLSTLTMHPRLGLSLLHAAVAGCVSAAVDVATQCAYGTDVFESIIDKPENIRNIKRNYHETSDHCALHMIQEKLELMTLEHGKDEVEKWCLQYGLSIDKLTYVKGLKRMHLEQLLKSGMIEPLPDLQDLNRLSGVNEMIAAILLSGSNSILKCSKYLCTKKKLKATMKISKSTGENAHLSTGSVNYSLMKAKNKQHLITYFGAYHSNERRALVVNKTSLVSPLTVLLFAAGEVIKKPDASEDTVILELPRHNLNVHVPSSQVDDILRAREMLWSTFQYYIQRDVMKVDIDENTTVSRFKVTLFEAIAKMLVEAHQKYVEDRNVLDQPEDTIDIVDEH